MVPYSTNEHCVSFVLVWLESSLKWPLVFGYHPLGEMIAYSETARGVWTPAPKP